jgi:malate/lactate dehydrogenase
MTNPNGKTEDYREINEYWITRLQRVNGMKLPDNQCKDFDVNIITLGYPRSTDSSRIKKFKHAGIEIREGKEEWGAKPGVKYFVIKHGEQIK